MRRTGTVAAVALLAALSLNGCQGRYNKESHYLDHYKSIIHELSSEQYQGRGYAAGGLVKAGNYIAAEFEKCGADVSTQTFAIDINTFYGNMEASVDGRPLEPGREFDMREYSPGIHGSFNLYQIDTANYDSAKIFADLEKPENAGALVVCDFWFTYKHAADFKRLQTEGGAPNAGLLQTWEPPLKFYKAYASKVVDKPIVWTTSDVVKGAKTITLDVDNTFIKDFESDNVIACVKGARHDSCYVFTAHYDHLGNLGKDVWFAGANDNASGTAAIITLAEYYAHHKPEFDMWFVAFSAEDSNLNGSNYFAEHPSMPLDQIKYLINLDMIGDNNPVQYCEISDAGMAAFPLWEKLNADLGCFESLNRGELAANSDHYPFAVRGVPCVFFENEGGDAYKYYHTVDDTWENAIFDSYLPTFRLVKGFVEAY